MPKTISRQTTKKSLHAQAQTRLAWMLLAPTLVVLSVVILWPVLSALYQSFFGVAGLDPVTGFISDKEPFVWFQNYVNVFVSDSARFWNAFINTTLLALITVVIETVLGVFMALIMHKAMRGRSIVRAAILVPWAIPTAVSAILWKWIFDSHGVANALLGTEILWAVGDWSAKWAVIIADVWKTAPFVGLLTLAGLQVISEDIYEAAKIDGAGPIRRFFFITLPLVKPALIVAVLFRALDALRMFDLPYILIGARKHSVETLSMLVQDDATNLRYGGAAASAMVLFLYVFLIAWLFIRFLGADIMGTGDKHAKRNRTRSLFRRFKGASSTDSSSETSSASESDTNAKALGAS